MPGMNMDAHAAPFSWHVLLTTYQSNPGWDVLIAALLLAYFWGCWTLRRRGEPGIGWYRGLSLGLGCLIWLLSVNTAIETYSHILFYVHMIQHLLLIMAVPALIVVSSPLTLLVRCATGERRARIERFLLSKPVTVLTFPITGVFIYASVIVLTHLTSFMNEMMIHPWLHQAEHGMYLVAGYLFLISILGDEPIRWHPPYLVRLIILFLAMAPETVVGIVLLQADHELFPAYAAIHRTWGPTPLHDLNRGGGIMWAFGDGMMMAFIVGLVLAFITHTAGNSTAGPWLENIRRGQLADRLDAAGESSDLGAEDLDSDETALAAYNRLLGRLHDNDVSPPPRR
jgi:cytochrome c oxidase assembly factor CtaG